MKAAQSGAIISKEYSAKREVNGKLLLPYGGQTKLAGCLMKSIRINGHIIEGALLIDDPDVKRAYEDASGQLRHVRSFTQPGRLKGYLKKHPEGLILAGVGNIFFIEPIVVTAAMIRFDETGSVDILVRDGAERIERQLDAIAAIQAAALE